MARKRWPGGDLRAELPGPLAHRLMAHRDAACRQEFLHHPQAEREAKVQPHRRRDDLGGIPVAGVAGIGSVVMPPIPRTARPGNRVVNKLTVPRATLCAAPLRPVAAPLRSLVRRVAQSERGVVAMLVAARVRLLLRSCGPLPRPLRSRCCCVAAPLRRLERWPLHVRQPQPQTPLVALRRRYFLHPHVQLPHLENPHARRLRRRVFVSKPRLQPSASRAAGRTPSQP